MRGTDPAGATVLLRGPVVLTTRDGRIDWTRFSLDPLTTSGTTSTAVSLVVDAPAERIFAVLRDPRRHPELDATGWLRHAETTRLVGAVGDTFVMAMHNDENGDFRIESHVVGFTGNRIIAWAPDQPGHRTAGHRFTWTLTPTDDGHTEVSQTYDWSAATHPAGLPKLPRIFGRRSRRVAGPAGGGVGVGASFRPPERSGASAGIGRDLPPSTTRLEIRGDRTDDEKYAFPPRCSRDVRSAPRGVR